MKDQTMKVLEHLETYGSITDMEARNELGVGRLSARIWELVHIYDEKITSRRIKVPTRDGWTHVALYELKQEAEA